MFSDLVAFPLRWASFLSRSIWHSYYGLINYPTLHTRPVKLNVRLFRTSTMFRFIGRFPQVSISPLSVFIIFNVLFWASKIFFSL